MEGQNGSDGPRVFQPVPAPTDRDIEALALRLAQRLGKLARRRFEQASEELDTLDTDTLPLRSVSAEAVARQRTCDSAPTNLSLPPFEV